MEFLGRSRSARAEEEKLTRLAARDTVSLRSFRLDSIEMVLTPSFPLRNP